MRHYVIRYTGYKYPVHSLQDCADGVRQSNKNLNTEMSIKSALALDSGLQNYGDMTVSRTSTSRYGTRSFR